MSDWINQFTSSYASSIAYGLTVLIISVLTVLLRPFLNFVSGKIRQFLTTRRAKQKNNLVLPTKHETQRFSTRPKPTENEWKDAVEFLKNDIPLFAVDSSPDELFVFKILAHFDKNIRVYQFAFIGFAVMGLIAVVFQARIWQTIYLVIMVALLIGILIFFLISFLSVNLYIKQEKSRVKKVKSEIRKAIDVIKPGIALTYGELGEFLKTVKEQDLPLLQTELSNVGLSFSLEDMKMAHFLSTAPSEKLIPVGEQMASRIEQLSNISPDKKNEAAQIFISALRLWPISFAESETNNKT
jgi:hypothetical protein